MNRPRRLLIATAAGVGYGSAGSILNDLSSPYGQLGGALAGTHVQAALRVLSTMTGAGWAWAALAVVVGWYLHSRCWSASAGASALASATTAYYALDAVLRAEPIGDSDILHWGAGGVLLGALLGFVGSHIGHPGARGLLSALTVPVGAAVQMVLLPQGVSGLQVASEAVWARWFVGIGSLLVAAWVVVRHRGQQASDHRSPRRHGPPPATP